MSKAALLDCWWIGWVGCSTRVFLLVIFVLQFFLDRRLLLCNYHIV